MIDNKQIIRRTSTSPIIFSSTVPAVLQRIYAARGIQSEDELDCRLEKLFPYHTLFGIDQAVVYLADALRQQQKMMIVGDFDADGATSTALAIRALRCFGAENVTFLVPNRFTFGYGLTPGLVEVAKKSSPDMIITVDNGIGSHAGVLAAKKAGMKVIVTDHHLAGETLPLADAIVNPNQPNDLFPSKNIAGVGVLFYLMLALRRYLVEQKWFEQQKIAIPNMSNLLDLVALGTVADVVALDQNNRVLVYQGLRRIRAKHCVAGITALLEIAGKNQSRVTASDLGFVVAPRLNAAGRLEDMSFGIQCLLTDDVTQAKEMAQVLTQLNEQRRTIEQDMHHQALHLLDALSLDELDQLPSGICLFDETWHQGVIGILAGRLKDRLHRPVIAFALGNEMDLKGSARSIPCLHIRDVLASISISYPQILSQFGGHAMAAGLTISRNQFENFRDLFNEMVSRQVTKEDLNQVVLSDGELVKHELTCETAEMIREAGPWGQAFSEPLFDGVFRLVDQRLVGNKHLKVVLEKENQLIDAIAFNVDVNEWPNYRVESIHAVYRLDVNEYRDRKKLQLIIDQFKKI